MSANPWHRPLAPDWLVQPDDANALDAGVWPSGAARAASGAIAIDGVDATALAAEFGTPLYVVDENDARTRATRLKAAFDDAFAAVGGTVKVYYAGKAFLSTEIARWMTAAGLNIDVCSSGELAVALAAGRRARRDSDSTATTRAAPRSTAVSGSGWARSSSTASSSSIALQRRRAPRAWCRPCGCASTPACTPPPTSTWRPRARTRSSASRWPMLRMWWRRSARTIRCASSACTRTSDRRSSSPTGSQKPPAACSSCTPRCSTAATSPS